MLCKPHSYANYGNSNLDHRIKIQWVAQGEWEGGFAKCDYLIQGRAVNCKITPSSCLLDLDSVVRIGVSIVCIRMWFAQHTLPYIKVLAKNVSHILDRSHCPWVHLLASLNLQSSSTSTLTSINMKAIPRPVIYQHQTIRQIVRLKIQ